MERAFGSIKEIKKGLKDQERKDQILRQVLSGITSYKKAYIKNKKLIIIASSKGSASDLFMNKNQIETQLRVAGLDYIEDVIVM